jgi:hypothetical protein
MSRREALAKIGKLQAMTVERGASAAEAETAARLAGLLIARLARHDEARRGLALAPGVHVTIV